MATTPRKKHPTRQAAAVNQHFLAAERDVSESADFDPDEALGKVWYEMTRTEALAQAAYQALEFLPGGQEPESRRAVERLHTLVMVTAEAASVALDAIDEQLSRLVSSMETRPESDESEAPSEE